MPSSIGRFEIGRTLGEGASCKVKLGTDTKTGRKVAVKIINDSLDQTNKNLVKNEVEAMGKFKHGNVVEQIECGVGTYDKAEGKKSRTVDYIVLELCQGGEVFDYVANSGKFEERIARYYFKQLLEGLDHVHMNGYAHRDVKP